MQEFSLSRNHKQILLHAIMSAGILAVYRFEALGGWLLMGSVCYLFLLVSVPAVLNKLLWLWPEARTKIVWMNALNGFVLCAVYLLLLLFLDPQLQHIAWMWGIALAAFVPTALLYPLREQKK